MNVLDFFKKLSYGELSDLHLGSDGKGYIRPEAQPKIISHANSVLSVLSARYSHKLNYVTLEQGLDMYVYALDSRFAVSNTDPLNLVTRYIKDSADDPFLDDVVKITMIDVPGSKMLSHKTFRIPAPVPGTLFKVEYKAAFPQLKLPVDLTQEVELIPALLEALEFGVAARVYRGMNGQENIVKAQQLEASMERVLSIVDGKDLTAETESTYFDKVADKGFI